MLLHLYEGAGLKKKHFQEPVSQAVIIKQKIIKQNM